MDNTAEAMLDALDRTRSRLGIYGTDEAMFARDVLDMLAQELQSSLGRVNG